MKKLLYGLFFITSLSFAQTDSISKKIERKINHNAENPVHSILFYVENENFTYNKAFGLIDREGDTVSKNSPFRIASSTKLFVATIILQLEEEGKLSIDDKIYPYLKDIDYLDFKNIHIHNGKKYAKKITIKHLLSHRSGLSDILSEKKEEFTKLVTQNPTKQYSPKEIIELYYQFKLNHLTHFKPNKGWEYSDMNYVLLGLLIEKLDGTSLATSVRNRILTPLKMNNTYFEFYEKPILKNKMIQQYVGNINFSQVNTSFDWAGGGLVSTNSDLAIFIKSLFNQQLINQKSLQKMLDVKFTKQNESRYGLGIYEINYNDDIYYGHFGFYGSFIGYSPKTKTTLSYSISQAKTSFSKYLFISELLKYCN